MKKLPAFLSLFLSVMSFAQTQKLQCHATDKQFLFYGTLNADLAQKEFKFLLQDHNKPKTVYDLKTFCTYSPSMNPVEIQCPFKRQDFEKYLGIDLLCQRPSTGSIITNGQLWLRWTNESISGAFQCSLRGDLVYSLILSDCTIE